MTDRKQLPANYTARIRGAWQGRVAGCMLGKAVERFSMRAPGRAATADRERRATPQN